MVWVSDLKQLGLLPEQSIHIGEEPINGLTATGTNQSTAFYLEHAINRFTTVASGTGCILPSFEYDGVSSKENAKCFKQVSIRNDGASALKVYPAVGEYINSLSVNSPFSIASGEAYIFKRVSETTWGVFNNATGTGGGSGVTAVGTINSQTKSANGLVIVGTDIFAQTADSTNPGLLSTGAQDIAGIKNILAGELKYSATQLLINSNTTDGSDNKSIYINGGGDANSLRGATLGLEGNEAGGTVRIYSGNSGTVLIFSMNNTDIYSTGDTIFYNGSSDELFRIKSNKVLQVNSSAYTASRPLKLDSSKNFISSQIDLASTNDVTGILDEVNGGTGQNSITQGDLLYGSASNTLSKLAKDTNSTRYLSNTGTSNNPAWSQVNLTNGVSGSLGATNGGTGQTSIAQGDLLYGSATNTISKLTKDTNATRYLTNTGTSNNPAWGQVNLANGVTGTNAIGNGGTGQTTAQLAINALTQISGATNEHVLTKDTATGNAVYKAVPTGYILSVTDTNSVDLTVTGTALSADVKLSTDAQNAITTTGTGIYTPDEITPGFVSVFAIGNSGTSETTAFTYNMPGNTMISDGDFLDIWCRGAYAANGNSKRIRLYFNGTQILDFTGAYNNLQWDVKTRVIRNSTNAYCSSTLLVQGSPGVNGLGTITVGSVTWSSAITIALTLTASSNNDITKYANTILKYKGS